MSKLAHLLVPRESNNHKAKLLHTASLSVLTLLIVIFQFGIRYSGSLGLTLGYAANISVDEVIRLTNEKRLQNGIGQVTKSDVLSQAALAKGADMLNDNYWAHVSPDGTQPWFFFSQAGYKYRYAGENLARDFSSAPAAVDAWMASPTHRDNLLSTKYTEIGIGVVEGDLNGVDTTIIVQFFGSQFVDTTPQVPVAKADSTQAVVTVLPTSTPIPLTPTPTPGTIASLAQASPEEPPGETAPMDLNKRISYAIVGGLMALFVVDGLVIYNKKIPRISGRGFAHFSFFAMILIIVLIAKSGLIL